MLMAEVELLLVIASTSTDEARWPSDPKNDSSTIKNSFDTLLLPNASENGVGKGVNRKRVYSTIKRCKPPPSPQMKVSH